MGFINRVPLAKLQSEAEELARELIAFRAGRYYQRARQCGDARDGSGNYFIRGWRRLARRLGHGGIARGCPRLPGENFRKKSERLFHCQVARKETFSCIEKRLSDLPTNKPIMAVFCE